MKMIARIGLCLVAGCSTTGADLRQRAPVATYTTSRPAAQVAHCLVDRIGSLGNPSVIADDTGTTVTFTEKGAATLTVHIYPDGSVRVWRLHALVRYGESVNACI